MRWGGDEQQQQQRRSGGGRGGLGPPPGLAPGLPLPGHAVPYDARMGQQLAGQQQAQQPAQQGQQQAELPPWERPSYMDLELQRQQQQQQQAVQQVQGVASPPPLPQQLVAASGVDPAAAGAFARALAQAAASLGAAGRGAAGPARTGVQPPSFRVTITHDGVGAGVRRLSAPLLQQPDLQQVGG